MRGQGKRKIKDDAIQKSSNNDPLWPCAHQQSGNIGSINSHTFEGGAIIIPIYQMRKPGFADIKSLLQTNRVVCLQWFVPFESPQCLESCPSGRYTLCGKPFQGPKHSTGKLSTLRALSRAEAPCQEIQGQVSHAIYCTSVPPGYFSSGPHMPYDVMRCIMAIRGYPIRSIASW